MAEGNQQPQDQQEPKGPKSIAQAEDIEAVKALAEAYENMTEQVGRVIVGQSKVVEEVLVAIFCRGHALLVGVPGLAKTLLIRTLSEVLHLSFKRIQFTPDLMPSDITGTDVLEEDHTTGKRAFRFVHGPLFANMILADEINRTPPKTQAALLEAMQEHSVTVGEETYKLPEPFFVLATQNPIEQEGTYPLPEAQLDRFMFKLLVGYATREQMHTILDRTTRNESAAIEPVLDAEAILKLQKLVRQVIVAPHVQDYAVRCVLGTHPVEGGASPLAQKYVRLGASPRAAPAIVLGAQGLKGGVAGHANILVVPGLDAGNMLAKQLAFISHAEGAGLVLGAKVRALVDGRANGSIEDVRSVLPLALRHRILLNFEGQADGVTPDDVVADVVDATVVERAKG